MGSASSLAPKLGPLGLSPKNVICDITVSTKQEWKGQRIHVKLIVQNRAYKVVITPSSSSLLIKSLAEPSLDRKKVKFISHTSLLKIKDIINLAKINTHRSYALT